MKNKNLRKIIFLCIVASFIITELSISAAATFGGKSTATPAGSPCVCRLVQVGGGWPGLIFYVWDCDCPDDDNIDICPGCIRSLDLS